ncbi:hypothetical protein BHE74_00047471, partial [Ensete ventricosum]
METISSFLHSLALTGVESYLGTQVETNEQDLKLQNHGNLEVFGTSMKFGGTSLLENTKEPKHDQCYVEPMSRCSVLDSSCATSLSVNTGPTFQSTHAQPAGQTSFLTEVSSSAKEMSSSINDHVPMEELRAVKNGCDWDTDREHNRHLAESVKEKGLCGDANYLPSQAPLTNNPSSNIEVCPSQSSKVEKYRHKKKYDPNVFFKVNGKLYQKLGKIGSGGSSEVHKVISSDCTIYALKKIRLKGRDYPTAYGFCQEIEYLNRLKGKSNIIQLVDYERVWRTACSALLLKKEEEGNKEYLASAVLARLSSPHSGRLCAVVARGSPAGRPRLLFLPCEEMERLPARGDRSRR